MEHDPSVWLHDILGACGEIKQFTKDLTLDKYHGNNLIKAAVERKFLVIGEAMMRLRDEAPDINAKISDATKIIGFRNILVHGYDAIDDVTVWSAIKEKIPLLEKEIQALI